MIEDFVTRGPIPGGTRGKGFVVPEGATSRRSRGFRVNEDGRQRVTVRL